MVQGGGLAGDLPADPAEREAAVGFLTDNVYIDSRISPYGKIIEGDIFGLIKFKFWLGDILPLACTIITALLLLLTFRKEKEIEKE